VPRAPSGRQRDDWRLPDDDSVDLPAPGLYSRLLIVRFCPAHPPEPRKNVYA